MTSCEEQAFSLSVQTTNKAATRSFTVYAQQCQHIHSK